MKKSEILLIGTIGCCIASVVSFSFFKGEGALTLIVVAMIYFVAYLYFIKSEKVIYTAWNVVDIEQLKKRFSPVHPNLFYHHSTNVFGSQLYDTREGRSRLMIIIGRLTTDKVDVLLVINSQSKNKHPHITLSTAKGIKPFEANKEIEENLKSVKWLSDSVKVVFRNN